MPLFLFLPYQRNVVPLSRVVRALERSPHRPFILHSFSGKLDSSVLQLLVNQESIQ